MEPIGTTASRTKEVLKRAMCGVLFIDKADYHPGPAKERDARVENLAGHKDRMAPSSSSIPK